MNFASYSPIFWWQPAAWLRVKGSDAASFLQGQFTNDLRSLASGGAVYGLWLTLKGKVLADSFVLPGGAADEFWIGSYFSAAGGIRERLEGYVIADDVTIEDQTGDWSAVTLFGADPAEADQPGVGFTGRRTRESHREWVFPKASLALAQQRLTGRSEITAEDVRRIRIEAGIPAIPEEIGPGDLPNEGGLEAEAISYTKGCYLGQEVMARLKSMGQVRRRLLRVAGTGIPVPPTPSPLFVGARPVGELRSAVATRDGFIGFAMLTLLHLQPGVALSLSADGAPAVTLRDQP